MNDYKTYFVLLDGWVMPFNYKPASINFKSGAQLFVTDPQTRIDYLPDWFGRYFDHSKFTEIKDW